MYLLETNPSVCLLTHTANKSDVVVRPVGYENELV